MKGIKVALKIPNFSVFRESSRELSKSSDESQNTLNLQLPHVLFTLPFAGAESQASRDPSHEINCLEQSSPI